MKPLGAPSHDSPPVLDAAAPPRSAVKSAARVLSILETFDDLRRPMRVGEIATLNAATVLAHVRQCCRQGWFFSDGMVTAGHGHVAMRLPLSMTDGRTVAIGVAGRSAGLRHGLAEVVGTLRRLIEEAEREMKEDSA